MAKPKTTASSSLIASRGQEPSLERTIINQKERQRTRENNLALYTLQRALPKVSNKNLVKKEVLTTATEYIAYLEAVSRFD